MTDPIGTAQERELIEILLNCCKRVAAEMEATAAMIRARAALSQHRKL